MSSNVWQNYTYLQRGFLFMHSPDIPALGQAIKEPAALPRATATGGLDLAALSLDIKEWGRELGFQQVGIAGLDLAEHEQHLQRWLDAGYQGEMDYMAAHGSNRSHPDELVPGTLRVISLRMDYLPGDTELSKRLSQPETA